MKVMNKTLFNTRQIRTIVCAVHNDIVRRETKIKVKGWESMAVHVRIGRTPCIKWRPRPFGWWLELVLPHGPIERLGVVTALVRIGLLQAHYHGTGIRVRMLTARPTHNEEEGRVLRRLGFSRIVEEPKLAKPKKTIKERRLMRVRSIEKLIDGWKNRRKAAESRIKRADKAIRKLSIRRRRIESENNANVRARQRLLLDE